MQQPTKDNSGGAGTTAQRGISSTTSSAAMSDEKPKQEEQKDEETIYDPKCIFCKILQGEIPSSTVYEDDICRIMMDIHPIRPGHALIIPCRHYENIMDMPPEVAMHMMRLAHQLTAALTANATSSEVDSDATTPRFECHGTNLLWNNGRVAWQTVMHAHLHVIPRSKGDSWRFVMGMICHLLSMLGLLPPAQRQELDRLAAIFQQLLMKQINKKSS